MLSLVAEGNAGCACTGLGRRDRIFFWRMATHFCKYSLFKYCSSEIALDNDALNWVFKSWLYASLISFILFLNEASSLSILLCSLSKDCAIRKFCVASSLSRTDLTRSVLDLLGDGNSNRSQDGSYGTCTWAALDDMILWDWDLIGRGSGVELRWLGRCSWESLAYWNW